jgi:metal-responsive CopG/Arc/MetJ family transcriptional regulator
MGKLAKMETVQRANAQVNLDLPPELGDVLHNLAKSVHQRRSELVRAILIQALRKIDSMKEPPSTLGDIENAIINGIE